MSNKPTHRAYVVSQPKESGGKGFWREVVARPYGRIRTATGFDVVIHEGISVYGKIVCREPKEQDDESPQ